MKISLNILIVISSISAFVGLLIGFLGRKKFAESKLKAAEGTAQKIVEEAEKKAESHGRQPVLVR